MPINIQDYLLGRIPVGRKIDIPAYLMAKAASGGIQEITGTLPLYVRSHASQILKNYIIYGTASGAGVRTENLCNTTAENAISFSNYKNFQIVNNQIISTGNMLAGILCKVSPNTTYTCGAKASQDNVMRIREYSARPSSWDSDYIGQQLNSYTNQTPSFTTTSTTEYIIFCFYTTQIGIVFSELMVVEGLIFPSSYIPYGYKLPLKVTADGTTTDYPIYIGDSKLGEEEYVDYAEQKVYKRTENLFNKDAKDTNKGYVARKYLGSNGSYQEGYSSWSISEYIDVEPNVKYQYQYNSGYNEIYLCLYDENKQFISSIKYGNFGYTIAFTTTAYTKFVRVSILNSKVNETQLIKSNSAPTSYTPYLQPTDPPVPLPDITLPQGIATIDTEEEFKYATSIKGRINPIHYAYHINPDTAEITYLADNKNFTPAAMGSTDFDYGSWENAFFMPRPCMLKSDGTVDYYLDPNDYSKKLDGTASDIADPTYDGNVMLEFPKIWYKFVPTGDDGEGGTFHCSNVKLDDDYECWCNYDANNNEIDHFYVAAYNAVILDSKMRSLSGYALTKENGADTTTGPAEIAAARANNQNGIDEWYTYLLADHQLLTYLATLMCKHVDHQTKFGRGIDSGSTTAKRAYVTGTLNDKGLFWGDTSSGTQAVKILGIENFYACVWKRTAGLIGTSTGYSYKLTHGTKDGSTATSFNTNGSGYKTIARTKPASGYVTTMHYEANGFWIPATTGTDRYGDYYYNGGGYALVGGASYNGSYCGSWCVSLASGVSGSDWYFSSALSCKPKA